MSTTKIDFRGELRELYRAGREPTLVEVPPLSFLMIDGHGDPNTAPAFQEAVQALFSVSYTVKFTLKRRSDGFDYAVMPLEGLWWTPNMAEFSTHDKSAWDWTAMIMQPAQVTSDLVADAASTAAKKTPLPSYDRLRLARFEEGLSAQVLHTGPYAAEAPTIERLHAFIGDHGLERHGKHHEIYLGDPRRSAPERLKTIIRQPVRA